MRMRHTAANVLQVINHKMDSNQRQQFRDSNSQ